MFLVSSTVRCSPVEMLRVVQYRDCWNRNEDKLMTASGTQLNHRTTREFSPEENWTELHRGGSSVHSSTAASPSQALETAQRKPMTAFSKGPDQFLKLGSLAVSFPHVFEARIPHSRGIDTISIPVRIRLIYRTIHTS